jgi:single-strand DNA-binding protein
MSGENCTSITGNLTATPQLLNVGGTVVANFTIASTPRVFDAQAKKWRDGQTLFLRASVWRDMAENVAASLTKGSRIVASGRLKPRTYETKAGEKRTVIEFEIDEIGLSLRHSAAAATGPQRTRNESVDGVREEAGHPADHFTISPREYADDDAWFGIHANPSGRVSIPGASGEPGF